jgi:hypothetical protein
MLAVGGQGSWIGRWGGVRLLRPLVCALALLSVGGAAPSVAALQEPPTQTPIQNPPGFKVEERSLKVKFPERADFSLRVANFPFVKATLSYGLAELAEEHFYYSNSQSIILGQPTEVVSVSLDLTRASFPPPGVKMEYTWLLKSKDGKQAATPAERFTVEDNRFTWRTVRSADGRIAVHWHSDNNTLGASVLERASRSLARVEGLMGHTYSQPIVIWVYAEPGDLHIAMGGGGQDWVGGVAYSRWGIIMAAISEGFGQQYVVALTIPHEVSHLVYHQATAGNGLYMPWLNEGLAVIHQEESDPANEIAPLRNAALDGELIPFDELSSTFSSADSDRALLAYAQSRSMVEFIVSRYGRGGVGKMLAALREGADEQEALEQGLGVKAADLEREWLAALPYKRAQAVEARSNTEAANTNSAQSRAAGQWVALIPALTCGLMILTIAVLGTISWVRRRRGYDLAEEEG